MLVSEVNCHPFQYGRFLWMHNGSMAGFRKFKRQLRRSLTDEIYNSIEGTTDSEHAFAVFLNRLGDPLADHSCEALGDAMMGTIDELNAWGREAGVTEPSCYNFAVTDGDSAVATRYVTDPGAKPPSLYYSSGIKFECRDGVCRMVQADRREHAVIVASEPLTDVQEDWIPVPDNHLVAVTPDLTVRLAPLSG